MKNKKYSIQIYWSDQENEYAGFCKEFPGLSVFGSKRAEVLKEVEKLINDFVEIFEDDGDEPPKPDVLK